jgi:hypothetical protein
MGKGSKPSKPSMPEPTATEIAQARISAEKWNDFTQRYLPVEGLLRDRTQALDSDAVYAKAMAQAANNASVQMGGASKAAAQQMAGGGSPLAMLAAYTGADEMSANGMVQQYGNQRANYLNQGNNLLKMGAGISGAGMGAFKSVADYSRSDANRAYADKVGRNLADASQRLGTLNAMGQTAMMLFGGSGPSGGSIDSRMNTITNKIDNTFGTDFGGYDAMDIQSRPSTGGYIGSGWR